MIAITQKLVACILCALCLCGCVATPIPEQSEASQGYIQQESVYVSPPNSAPEESKAPKPTVFVVDAGHGFVDSGCVTEYLNQTEAEITLDMANRLKGYLEQAGVSVILTHDGVNYPSPEEIIKTCRENSVNYIADKITDDGIFSAYERGIYYLALSKNVNIAMFVSIHVNSFPADKSVDRYELYYRENNPYAKQLNKMCSSFAKKLDNKTKIIASSYDDAFIVTKYGNYPSLLVETGFATNKQAAEKLNNPEWRDKFCGDLAEQMIKYFG